ncbi:MAG: 5-oxoprolinase subunit PxpA [Gemmatales bacterium]|nr:LamB/YcsF family protein [Gemmatales bacterium]MDW7993278.1 5-oxoprolinase subunit PxpA [Gemmatales bacterium]
MQVDLNADVAEGTGNERELLPLVTSANVACAAHAGLPADIWETLQLAKHYGIVVGAHPGYFDREHFGRRELSWQAESLRAELVYQLGGLQALAQAVGISVRFLKPHGALYNQACREEALADLIARIAAETGLALVGLPNSWLERCAVYYGVRFVREGFADRRYQPDGSLVPRHRSDAFLDDPHEAAEQVLRLIRQDAVETVCVHGDRPHVVGFTRQLREALSQRGIALRPWTTP